MTSIDLSICWQFDNTSPREGLRRLASLGYEGIELWPNYINAFPFDEWLAALKQSKMQVFQLCPYFNFMEGQPKIDASREMLAEYLSMARATDCKRIRVFTGPPWGDRVVGANDATATQWSDAIASLREFCDTAVQDGVELCLECHEGSLMEDAPNALKLIAGVDRSNLTVNLQIPFAGEDWKFSVEQLGPHTTHIHIHNWIGDPALGNITFLAEGSFDWKPVVIRLVQGLGRRLTLSPEHITHNNHDDAWETAERDITYLKALREAADSLV
ncbi:MAG TPA: sugar phosphate isomerase/epimerase family protein [Capsulimonadaceae bacterium]|jgi:sugar phosphate isomerase/epimerase